MIPLKLSHLNRCFYSIFFSEGYGARVLNTLRWISKINEFPLILGREFCGVVKAKGKSVRPGIQIGDKVWGVVPPQRSGSIAEYVVVHQNTVRLRDKENHMLTNVSPTLMHHFQIWLFFRLH